ncbi:MAG: YHS domain-containing protein [Planctomycetota bacterium]|jgi:YHS domain-containing protein
MNAKSAKVATTVLVTTLAMIGLVVIQGCKEKSEPPAAPAAAAAAAEIVQKTCPVMGGAINKDVFVEHKGKKVYFCCPPCKEKFEANPENYLAKLPQFKN